MSAEGIDRLLRAARVDPAARDRVIAHACDRLERLARRMLRDDPVVRRWAETGDVLTEALTRLHRMLARADVRDEGHFWAIAANDLRQVLIDLARRFKAAGAFEANHHTDGAPADDPGGPVAAHPAAGPDDLDDLDDWARFHEAVGRLPDPLRAVVHLHWYDGLDQAAVAAHLGVDVRTVKRYWQQARLRLHEQLADPPTG